LLPPWLRGTNTVTTRAPVLAARHFDLAAMIGEPCSGSRVSPTFQIRFSIDSQIVSKFPANMEKNRDFAKSEPLIWAYFTRIILAANSDSATESQERDFLGLIKEFSATDHGIIIEHGVAAMISPGRPLSSGPRDGKTCGR